MVTILSHGLTRGRPVGSDVGGSRTGHSCCLGDLRDELCAFSIDVSDHAAMLDHPDTGIADKRFDQLLGLAAVAEAVPVTVDSSHRNRGRCIASLCPSPRDVAGRWVPVQLLGQAIQQESPTDFEISPSAFPRLPCAERQVRNVGELF